VSDVKKKNSKCREKKNFFSSVLEKKMIKEIQSAEM